LVTARCGDGHCEAWSLEHGVSFSDQHFVLVSDTMGVISRLNDSTLSLLATHSICTRADTGQQVMFVPGTVQLLLKLLVVR
jgi:hypothetical protein